MTQTPTDTEILNADVLRYAGVEWERAGRGGYPGIAWFYCGKHAIRVAIARNPLFDRGAAYFAPRTLIAETKSLTLHACLKTIEPAVRIALEKSK